MAAGTYNITAERNTPLVVQIVYKDNSDVEADLSGSTITLSIKQHLSDAATTYNLDTNANSDLANGRFDIDLSVEAVNALTFNQGIYYIDINGSAGNDGRVLEGKIQIQNNSAY